MGLHDDEMRQRLRSQTLQTGLQFEHVTAIVLSTVPVRAAGPQGQDPRSQRAPLPAAASSPVEAFLLLVRSLSDEGITFSPPPISSLISRLCLLQRPRDGEVTQALPAMLPNLALPS